MVIIMTLNELNFNDLLVFEEKNIDQYSFDDYLKNNCIHPKIIDYCTDCDEKIKVCEDESFHLKNISHGSKSEDFIKSIYPKLDTENWYQDGVMFIMESPSKDYDIYKEVAICKNEKQFTKCPSYQWYWIHNAQEISGFPQYFKGREYGRFVSSAIVTFRLANAYMTNLIKCGLNGPNDTYKGIADYNEECIKTCANKYLKREIEIVKPKVIFTFGSTVFNWVNQLVNSDWEKGIKVVGLPHPARQRSGFKDEYYNVLYFCMIAKWLYREKVIDENFYNELMIEFSKSE